MNESNNISILKLGFWGTVILAILKLSNIMVINTWVVFLPLIISVGILMFVIFIIGLLTILIYNKMVNTENSDPEEVGDDS